MPAKKSASPNNRSLLFVLCTFLLLLIASVLYITGEPPFGNGQAVQQRARLSRPDNLVVDYPREFQSDPIDLPLPQLDSSTSVEQALAARRTQRTYDDTPVTLEQVSQLLWAAQGVTADWGGRTAPSAKNAYPLTVYLVAKNVDGLDSGIYQYIPGDDQFVHRLGLIKAGDFGSDLSVAAVQKNTDTAPAALVITGNFQKMAQAFDGVRNDNNVYLEAGHAAQNLYLESESLGLGMVVMGGYNKVDLAKLLDLPAAEQPIYLIPFGYPQAQ